ncbi:MAG: hypothetical protein HZA81_04370 [Candidatus Taylorbacteria bacterium]|nr:hypothetical protein [Candidatus Taylorbacteria bacterium]
MEPNENSVQDDAKAKEQEKAAVADLHAEGIDIVSSDMAVDSYISAEITPTPSQARPAPSRPENRFSKPSEAPRPYPRPEPRPLGPQAPAPKDPFAARPEGSLQSPAPAQSAPSASLQGEIAGILKTETARPTFDGKPDSKNDPSIKPLRTFKSDAEEAIRYQNVSTVDIAVAAEKKRQESTPIEYDEEKRSSPKAFILGAFALIALIGAGWYYWFLTSQESAPQEAATAIQIRTLIPYSKAAVVTLEAESDPLALISAKLAVSNPGLGNVYALIPVESAGAATAAPVSSVFAQTKMPSRLARSLGGEYMLGLYVYDSESPFILLKNTFFQNAFAGMLEWEKEMRNDLLSFIRIPRPEETITPETDRFEDMVVSNVDARALKNKNGEVILVYAFADKDTIALTTSVNSLKYLLDRILAVRTIQ